MSSRRRSTLHRRASSDIEDGNSSQPVVQDDVDDEDDEQPRRPKQLSKTASSKKKGKERALVNDLAEDEDDEDERIDITNFTDQPLRKEDVTKINGLARDWQMVADQLVKFGQVFGTVGVSLADASHEETTKSLVELEKLLKQFIDTQAEMRIHSDVLENIGQDVAKGGSIVKVIEQYEDRVQQAKEKYSTKTSRQKYAKDDTYRSFKADLYEVDHPGSAMPPVTDFIPKEDGDDSDDDDDLEVGGVTQDYKCPITLTPLKNPVTSEVCGHSFSQDAIKEMFRNDRGAKKCPAAGCNKSFTIAHCKPNKALEKKIKLFERRQKRREEEQDAEEVVE